jgi:hypothetical protein
MKEEKDLKLQEVVPETLESGSSSDCEFCGILCRSESGEDGSAPSGINFMTERELRVLASMRRLKEEVAGIKGHMRKMEGQGSSEEALALSALLTELREDWQKLDKERMDAAEERMRLLGHIQ